MFGDVPCTSRFWVNDGASPGAAAALPWDGLNGPWMAGGLRGPATYFVYWMPALAEVTRRLEPC